MSNPKKSKRAERFTKIVRFLNYWFIQLFFIRIYWGHNIAQDKPNDLRIARVGILYLVYPFTGWSKPFKYVYGDNPHFFKIWGKPKS